MTRRGRGGGISRLEKIEHASLPVTCFSSVSSVKSVVRIRFSGSVHTCFPCPASLTLNGVKTILPSFHAWWPGALALALFAGLFPPARAGASDHQIGDTATNDITTPLRLIVLDPQRTAALRQAEAQRIAPFFRLDPSAAAEAEARLRAAFADARAQFLDKVEASFNKRKLFAPGLANARFARLIGSFQKQQKDFPLTTNLARLWALGDAGTVVVTNLAAPLREIMRRTLRPDVLPSGEKLSTPNIRLLPPRATDDTPLDLAAAEKLSRPFARSNLTTVGKARQELQKAFGPEDKVAARFVAGFVRANCLIDEDLTRQARAHKTNELYAADHYEPGQVIVPRGEIIDARRKLALDELQARTAPDEARAQAAEARQQAEIFERERDEEAARADAQTAAARRQTRWLAGGLAATVVVGLGLWAGFRRRPHPSLALIRPDATSDWRQRALAAEQRADQAVAIVRAGLLPHLARWWSQTVLQRLLGQRAQLLDHQHQAEREVGQLEARLIQLQAPLQERLRAYEERIAELERTLATKSEENRELLQAAIASTRRKLEAERARQPLAWN